MVVLIFVVVVRNLARLILVMLNFRLAHIPVRRTILAMASANVCGGCRTLLRVWSFLITSLTCVLRMLGVVVLLVRAIHI